MQEVANQNEEKPVGKTTAKPFTVHNTPMYDQSLTSFPGSSQPSIYIHQIVDLAGRKSNFVFFVDSFAGHFNAALYHTVMR